MTSSARKPSIQADDSGGRASLVRTRPPLIEALRQRREELGLSGEAVADRIGVADYLVRWWECGHRVPSTFMAEAWAEALGLRLVLLLVEAPPGGSFATAPGRRGGQKRAAADRPGESPYFCPPWGTR